MAEQLKCPYCGQKINKNDKYCPKCGVWINPISKMPLQNQYVMAIIFLLSVCLLAYLLYNYVRVPFNLDWG